VTAVCRVIGNRFPVSTSGSSTRCHGTELALATRLFLLDMRLFYESIGRPRNRHRRTRMEQAPFCGSLGNGAWDDAATWRSTDGNPHVSVRSWGRPEARRGGKIHRIASFGAEHRSFTRRAQGLIHEHGELTTCTA